MLKENKGQMEIFGLVIVVVIITFVIVLSLVFFSKPKSFFVGNERIFAGQWTEAMLAFTTDCFGMKVEDLLSDCAQSSGTGRICTQGSFKGKGTCKVAEQLINDMIVKTLGKWQFKHALVFKGSENLEGLQFRCNFQSCKKFESAVRSVPISRGLEYTIMLQMCRDIPDPKEPACV